MKAYRCRRCDYELQGLIPAPNRTAQVTQEPGTHITCPECGVHGRPIYRSPKGRWGLREETGIYVKMVCIGILLPMAVIVGLVILILI